ncbi:D-cysteine desulfhydrase [Polymorphobacter arshaanensis]|uniref:D-cysteine desulfhydrase n=1 Tax=Glacieibacterium arshaanense TaxID=2511025 RepID=A0A4Y9EKT3_9SPHN|nr:D-cysteine desulfhydrase [Polymorphobacter arshaanensis]TFU01371.1 D-cysteine desulfhydrase [Polymorphobacter arshaanensis]
MNLARFPRRRYTAGFTPLEPLPRLSALLGPELWIKRDDLLGLAGGGNKTRKLEFLVAEALREGADTLVTVGAPQSNHCRLTLAAAAREGLHCRLIIEERVPGTYSPDALGNNLLFDLMGVESITPVALGSDLGAAMAAEAAAVAALGRRAYVIPGGGSNPLGALGYASCAQEIMAQSFDQGVAIDRIIVASGSAGTHAGLLVGLTALNAGIPLTGINVRRPQAEQEANVHALAVTTAALLGTPVPDRSAVSALDRWVGPGYSLPTPSMVEAVRLLASVEGIMLDPVYTGKAMAGLIGLAREGVLRRGERVLFIHTGGSPSLHAYAPALRDPVLQPQ